MVNTQLYLIIFTALIVFLSSNAKYIGTPTNASEFHLPLQKSLKLTCEYTGADGNGQFLGWYQDNIPIIGGGKHYTVKISKTKANLIILLNETDGKFQKWFVKTDKRGQQEPRECQFRQITLIPSPQGMETNRPNEKLDPDHLSVRRAENEPVRFKCNIQPNQTNTFNDKEIRWSFSRNDEDKSYSSELPTGARITSENEIAIARVIKAHRGYYRCTLNDHSFTTLLRVKDPFAVIWPFIGIVSTVLVLVVIILIYEKRHKAARKAAAAAAEDEVTDNANDPLVRSSNKLSDNENKKRTVNT